MTMHRPSFDGQFMNAELRQIAKFPNYWVSADGHVYNAKGQILKPSTRSAKELRPGNDHLRIELWRNGFRKWRTIHSLVLEAFDKPRPKGLQCRHLDGNTQNNRIENLKWGTPKENSADTIRHGRTAGGGNKSNSAITECPSGHEYTEDNTVWRQRKSGPQQGNWYRQCGLCLASNKPRPPRKLGRKSKLYNDFDTYYRADMETENERLEEIAFADLIRPD